MTRIKRFGSGGQHYTLFEAEDGRLFAGGFDAESGEWEWEELPSLPETAEEQPSLRASDRRVLPMPPKPVSGFETECNCQGHDEGVHAEWCTIEEWRRWREARKEIENTERNVMRRIKWRDPTFHMHEDPGFTLVETAGWIVEEDGESLLVASERLTNEKSGDVEWRQYTRIFKSLLIGGQDE